MAEETTTETTTETVKPGWKTTEFWTSIASALSGVLFLAGYFTPTEANEVIAAIEKIAGGLMVIGPTIAYAISRGKSKTGTIDFQALVTALAAAIPEAEKRMKGAKKE